MRVGVSGAAMHDTLPGDPIYRSNGDGLEGLTQNSAHTEKLRFFLMELSVMGVFSLCLMMKPNEF